MLAEPPFPEDTINVEPYSMTDSSIPPDTSIGAEDAEYIPPPASTGVTTNALLHSQAEPWTINAGASIAAMSANPTHTQVVVAGREVLRIFSTETLAETLNIRFGRINMLYSSNDVRWNPNESHNHLIATAATNGAVVIWNINMKGKKLGMSRVPELHVRALLIGLYEYFPFDQVIVPPSPTRSPESTLFVDSLFFSQSAPCRTIPEL